MTDSSPANHYELTDPDVQLMLQVRDGNAAAFEALVLRYQHRLVQILEHVVRTHEQAEDLAQEVFLRVYRARERYVPQAKFSTWLFTIANNVARNALRSSARRREYQALPYDADGQQAPLEQMAMESSGLMPSRQLARLERAEILHQAIQALNERQRMALLLAKFEDMSYEEIAQAMELSVPATKSLLARARENLRVLLEPYLQDGVRPVDASES